MITSGVPSSFNDPHSYVSLKRFPPFTMSANGVHDVEANLPYTEKQESSHTSLEESEKEVKVRVKYASQYPILDVTGQDRLKRQMKQRHIQMWVHSLTLNYVTERPLGLPYVWVLGLYNFDSLLSSLDCWNFGNW